MIKVKRIKLSGFRGILQPQEIDLTIKGKKEPCSLVLFGLNSSGKTSFVDGLEWFLSGTSKIEWLQREEAQEKAYPHQVAKDKNIKSFVEIEFYDTDNQINKLIKTFNHDAKKNPNLSNEESFKKIYESAFVIRPYFRYLEVIDFVVSPAKEKYKRLAQWMGFESEFDFQEKISLGVLQGLKNYEKELENNISIFEEKITKIINCPTATDNDVFNFCNEILRQHKTNGGKNIKETWGKISELNKKKSVSSVGIAIDKLTKLEGIIAENTRNENLSEKLAEFEKKVSEFKKDSKKVEQIDVISLYTRASEILTKQTDEKTKCPICGKEWERSVLMEHIRKELECLRKTKEKKEEVEQDILILKNVISKEISSVKELITNYAYVKEYINDIKHDKADKYLSILNKILDALPDILTDKQTEIKLDKQDIKSIAQESARTLECIKKYKNKKEIQLSAAEIKLSEDVAKLTLLEAHWQSLSEAKEEQKFAVEEIKKFYTLKDVIIKIIQENIESRFKEISERIQKYFGILRDDKDITDIEIKLNKEKGRAAGRTAEIQLNYYNISVKPAYKVLSESLLNSLGLAIYFTCIKQFNDKCKFIVLDDIMNSLDVDKRDTLLDLFEKEFSDYQIIIFTHDLYWFQKIVRRFPNWDHKKIKSWDYLGGVKIDSITTTKEEIDECLSDSTRIEEAGWKLGRHAESILNELCENLWAFVRYRYTKNDPPTMEELFNALYARLKNKIKTHPIIDKVLETKKYESILRNFTSHPRNNQPMSLSPQDIKRASNEWFSLEIQFWRDDCNRFVEYHKSKDNIECKCGKKKLRI